MIESLLVVLTNAVEGRDDDFNDWYSNVHARDAMRMRGSIAQQRFRFSDEQVQDFPEEFIAQYLALYEVFDAKLFSQEHIDRVKTPYMVIEDSLDMSRLHDFYYYPLHFRDKAPRNSPACSVVLEQFQIISGREESFRQWYSDSYLPQRFKLDGVSAVSLLTFDEYGQMMPFPPAHNHIAIWRLDDDRARAFWRDSDLLDQCADIETGSTTVTCWDICSERITEDDVHNPRSAALAKEEAARARIKAQGSTIVSAEQRIKS